MSRLHGFRGHWHGVFKTCRNGGLSRRSFMKLTASMVWCDGYEHRLPYCPMSLLVGDHDPAYPTLLQEVQ